MSFAFSLISMSVPVLPLSSISAQQLESYFYDITDQETFLLKTLSVLLSQFFLSVLPQPRQNNLLSEP